MNIQINTGSHLHGGETLTEDAKTIVEDTLGHLMDHITRVEVHLSDENGNKGGDHDKRCVIEARLNHHQPVAVTHEAQTINQAITGASDKLKSLLDHTVGRLNNRERVPLKESVQEILSVPLADIEPIAE